MGLISRVSSRTYRNMAEDGTDFEIDTENLKFNQTSDETVFPKFLKSDFNNSLLTHSKPFGKTYLYVDGGIKVLEQPEIDFKIQNVNGLFINADSEHLAILVKNKILILTARKLEVISEIVSSDN